MLFEKRRESEAHSILSSRWGDFNNYPSRSSTVSDGNKSSGERSTNVTNPFRYKRRRVMDKNGQLNILRKNFSRKLQRRFLKDIFYTMVDNKWRWTFIIFTIWYIISWLVFAFIWLMVSTIHGDLDEDHLPLVQGEFFLLLFSFLRWTCDKF